MIVKIIDIIEAVLRYNKKQGNYPSEINAIIEGKDKIILTDDEGVHTIHSKNDSLELLTIGTIPIKDLLKISVERKEDLNTFIRTFGDRIERNYIRLLKSIKEIGLNPNNYLR